MSYKCVGNCAACSSGRVSPSYAHKYLHCIADLLPRASAGELACEIAVIVSNHRDVETLAAFHNVRFEYIPITPVTREQAETQQLVLLESLGVELVVLARYMQILSETFVARYPASIINVHHSFLPAFIGARARSQADRRDQPLRNQRSRRRPYH
jgi:formyltetrahydrofolate deformylase